MDAALNVVAVAIALAIAAEAHGQVFEAPLPPHRKFNDRKIVDCVRNGVEGLRPRFGQLLEESHELRRNNRSIAPLIIEHRRLEERWCEAEARCAAGAVPDNKDLIYGETFWLCISALPRREP